MNKVRTQEWIFYLIVAIIIGISMGVALRDCNPIEPVVIPATYEIETFEKVDAETTGEFFERVKASMNNMDEKHMMHAFIPIFDVDSPTVVGAIVTYRRR